MTTEMSIDPAASTAPEQSPSPNTPPVENPSSSEPQPVQFADFGLHPDIQRAIVELGYVTPTPIQAQAIPIVLTGKDVMGAAQTGTGKTAGFALPILDRLMPMATTSPSPARHPVRALMLAPTRELADQIYANVKEYAKHTPLRVACVYGGVDMKPQSAALRAGVEVLIATPGRLLDHIEQKNTNLSQAALLVLDEADRMLDMGFLPDIQRIINLLPKPRQSLLFSATFSDEIKRLAGSFMVQPVVVEVARRNATNENVTQAIYKVESSDAKRAAVAQLVKDHNLTQVIVFSNTKLGTARLARQLAKEGLRADAIHGDKTQLERLKTLEDFKANRVDVLVATDVAARGLDIAELPAVINFDIPRAPEDYVHRATGIAISLIAPGDERYLADIEKLIKKKLPIQALQIAERVTTRERSRSSEASERGDDRAYARGPSFNQRGDGAGSRRERVRSNLPGHSQDDFFFKPYEDVAAIEVADATLASAASATASKVPDVRMGRSLMAKRPTRLVPALLRKQ
jgi:ATP-dependent RNA helicase RhlE